MNDLVKMHEINSVKIVKCMCSDIPYRFKEVLFPWLHTVQSKIVCFNNLSMMCCHYTRSQMQV